MAQEPQHYDDLTPERQQNLVAHFMSEFNLTADEALAACRELDPEDFELHLIAAEEGYI